jgi:chorismate dehydratase
VTASATVRLGAVSYLNTRPLVYGLERDPAFDVRFDIPSRCAELLHEGAIDLGLIPSIEYLRGRVPYSIVPDVSLASRGAVASVALYTAAHVKDLTEVRSIALDVSSRTSIALTQVLCARLFKIGPKLEPHTPDIGRMLAHADAALLIGDNALFLDHRALGATKIDLGRAWFDLTGLPFVYAVWAGRPGALDTAHVAALQEARDAGVARPAEIAARCFADERRRTVAERYLRDNMKYGLGDDEEAGLRLFFRYAGEIGLVPASSRLRFYP